MATKRHHPTTGASMEINLAQLYDDFARTHPNRVIVTGRGRPTSGIVLIGEAPGREEIRQKKPFVGSAGKILQQVLDALSITDQDIYVTNAVKYRLEKQNPKTGRLINRPVAKKDIEACRPLLLEELKLISPRLIVPMGNTPLRFLMGSDRKISDVRGRILKVELQGQSLALYPVFHPAGLIYNPSLKETFAKDMHRLAEWIAKGHVADDV